MAPVAELGSAFEDELISRTYELIGIDEGFGEMKVFFECEN